MPSVRKRGPKPQVYTPAQEKVLAELKVVAFRLRQAQRRRLTLVKMARRSGIRWVNIGKAMGTTGEAPLTLVKYHNV